MGKKQIRENFRNSVFERDGHKCRICNRSDVKLDAHHIIDRHEMPNGGYVKENGITLCDTENGCHMKAELYHISEHKEWVDGFHPSDLFKLIGSNEELAVRKSEQL